jgi:hypothetical protein
VVAAVPAVDATLLVVDAAVDSRVLSLEHAVKANAARTDMPAAAARG